MKKIIDVIPTSALFYVVEKRVTSYGRPIIQGIAPIKHKVIAWGLVETEDGQRWVEPLILGERALLLMSDTSEWAIEAT